MKKLELLAPAGHMEALKAAVFAGADGVYLGGKEFNARRNAANFSRDEIEEIVKYCHTFGVKVYITVNILLKDSELEEVIDYIQFLYEASVDAVIIQDLGLFYILRESFPRFPIHSSTQMFIHGLSGAKLLEGLGFERIVAARELTAKEIKDIVDNTSAEIKIFNHGAMCISYSGQCLMSSMIGGRSGNRGSCAQPCRKPYELLIDNKSRDSGHLISPKDLNTLDIIDKLIDTGAHSLKIEGRKKTAEYVYTVVSAYRKLIDSYYDGTNLSLNQEEKKAVEQAFNRNFTTGYFLGEKRSQDELITKEIPKNQGIIIGEIIDYKNHRAKLKLKDSLIQGDGILITGHKGDIGEKIHHLYNKNGHKIFSAEANDIVTIPVSKRVYTDDKVYKTFDNSISFKISETLEDKYPYRLPVRFEVRIKEGYPIDVILYYNDYILKVSGERLVEKAINRALDKERVKIQFSKLGDTPFTLESIFIHMDEDVIVPISEINKIRRNIIGELEDKLTKINRPKVNVRSLDFKPFKRNPSKEKLVVKLQDIDKLKEVIHMPVDKIIFGGDIPLNFDIYKSAAELCHKGDKEIQFAFPTVTRNNYTQNLANYIVDLEKLQISGVLLANYELISLFQNRKIKIDADYKFNSFNRFSMLQLKKLGFNNVCLPVELNKGEIDYLINHSPIGLSLLVYGNIELMITEYNLLGKDSYALLKDKRDFKFPVKKDHWNRTHIYNSKILSLYDEMENFRDIRDYRIDITTESTQEIADIAECFYEKLSGLDNHKEKLTTKNLNITKGHYRRGVK